MHTSDSTDSPSSNIDRATLSKARPVVYSMNKGFGWWRKKKQVKTELLAGLCPAMPVGVLPLRFGPKIDGI